MLICDGLQGVTASGYAKSLPMLQLVLQARHAKPVACVSTNVIDANTIPVTSATDIPVAAPTVSDWLMMQQRVSELSRALQDSQLSIAVLTDQLDTMLLNQSTTSVKIAQKKESPVNTSISSGATQNVVAVETVAETPEP